jgi:hypothetical protein
MTEKKPPKPPDLESKEAMLRFLDHLQCFVEGANNPNAKKYLEMINIVRVFIHRSPND